MKKFYLLLILLAICFSKMVSAQQYYTPQIEPAQIIKTDPKLITISGYLVVPENRKKPTGTKIKLPFTFVRKSDQSPTANVTLYTTGGPGYSTTANIDSIAYNSGFLRYGGFIAMDQRGTKRALPCLACDEVDEAIKRSYRKNLNRDSLVMLATKECRKHLMAKGIDLSSYTTFESAEDINDLRKALKLDSLNLVGISYSGGLMLAVAKIHPDAVKTLVLNSPLPAFVNYEERGLLNLNEALEQVFQNCKADSSSTRYRDIRKRFQEYFTYITRKKFSVNYLERGTKDSLTLYYGKSELIEVIENRLNSAQVSHAPRIIADLLDGNHKTYITELMNGYFSDRSSLSLGMRYSVYCTEQIAYVNSKKQALEENKLPWLLGYRFNNVNEALCNCWNVRPEPKHMKQPTVSNIPALIVSGDIDPWTRHDYHKLIKETMPNAQLMLRHNQGHGPGFNVDGIDYLKLFMDNPYKKLVSNSVNLKIE